jgi:hypothetical protein
MPERLGVAPIAQLQPRANHQRHANNRSCDSENLFLIRPSRGQLGNAPDNGDCADFLNRLWLYRTKEAKSLEREHAQHTKGFDGLQLLC